MSNESTRCARGAPLVSARIYLIFGLLAICMSGAQAQTVPIATGSVYVIDSGAGADARGARRAV